MDISVSLARSARRSQVVADFAAIQQAGWTRHGVCMPGYRYVVVRGARTVGASPLHRRSHSLRLDCTTSLAAILREAP